MTNIDPSKNMTGTDDEQPEPFDPEEVDLTALRTSQKQLDNMGEVQQQLAKYQEAYEGAQSASERIEALRMLSQFLRNLNRETYDQLENE